MHIIFPSINPFVDALLSTLEGNNAVITGINIQYMYIITF